MNNKGFTLLVAIITTSILLLISFMISNLALKQLTSANASRESQYAFYAADSGVECAAYWDLQTPSSFSTSTAGSVTCNSGGAITTNSQTVQTIPNVLSRVGGGGDANATSIFQINFTKGCAIVAVNKNFISGTLITSIVSKGYNTCSPTAGRRYERGISLSYTSEPDQVVAPPPPPPPPSAPVISSSLASAQAGNSTTVSWNYLNTATPNPQATNWIGLYNSGGVLVAGSGIYAGSCSSSQALPNNSGSCPFTIPVGTAAGPGYLFRLYASAATTLLATSQTTFTVDAPNCTAGTGGAVTNVGGYRIHIFTSSAQSPFVAPVGSCASSVEYLVVAGGGAGDDFIGGGGGGGGVLFGTDSLTGGASYAITIGAGGVGGSNGGNSIFNSHTAIGGGHGGFGGQNGTAGGSGGGAGGRNKIGGAGTAGPPLQGRAGGDGNWTNDTSPSGAGGGGGYSQTGFPGSTSGAAGTGGNGGAGYSSSISGVSVTYAGGGGGAGGIANGTSAGTAGIGGAGGGGTAGNASGGNGSANTGGGGGGCVTSGCAVGRGGTGIVIIRYVYP